MTAISRLNTTIGTHTVITNFIAVCLMISGAIVGAVAISQGSDLAKSTYDSLKPSTSIVQKSAAKVQVAPTTSTLTVETANVVPESIQSWQPDMVAALQPATMVQDTDVTADTLQPSTNYVQLTGGANLQNAAAVLQ